MMKVLLLMSLFGLSFSVLAKAPSFPGCDLVEAPEEVMFTKNATHDSKVKAIALAKDKALSICQKKGYSNCRVTNFFSKEEYRRGIFARYMHYASATVVGEKKEKRSYEDRKASLCLKINECVLNADEEISEKGLDRLMTLFKMNEC